MQRMFSGIFTLKLEGLKIINNFFKGSLSKLKSEIGPMFPSITPRLPQRSLGYFSTPRSLQRLSTFFTTLLSFFSVVYITFVIIV